MSTFTLAADYRQFYLFDDEACPAYPEDITDSDLETRLKSVPNLVAVYTQSDVGALVDLECYENAPQIDASHWAHIVEAPLSLTSGRIVLASPSSYLPDCPRVTVSPGPYRVRVSSDSRVKGERERYQVSVWPCEVSPVAVIKSRGHHAA
jgi:hypothetical protein